MDYFFVFQNRTFYEEKNGGFLWAPKYGKDGGTKSHWAMMKNIHKGDAIIHSVKKEIVAISFALTDCYSSPRPEGGFTDWERDGWRVDVEYHTFRRGIITSDYMDTFMKLQPGLYAPFNSIGRGNTGYLFKANKAMYEFIVEKTSLIQRTSMEKDKVLELLNR